MRCRKLIFKMVAVAAICSVLFRIDSATNGTPPSGVFLSLTSRYVWWYIQGLKWFLSTTLFTSKQQKISIKNTAFLDFDPLSFRYFVSFRHPNAHHQVSIQLDYTGDVQNKNSQHFSHVNA